MKRRYFLFLTFFMPLLAKATIFNTKEKNMSMTIHRADQRGSAEHGWLHSKFSFSFAHYYNPQRMGFGALRVINDDIVEPGQGFGMHPHQNMEIISIVTQGSLEHKDSFGNHGVINAGEIQYMSAGQGVYHSEYNPSSHEKVAFFQIWIEPDTPGGTPLYDKRDFTTHDHNNQWVTLVSNNLSDDAMRIKQNAKISTTQLSKGHTIDLNSFQEGHGRLLFIIEGEITIDGNHLYKRDEAQIIDDENYQITAIEESRIILFEVPMKSS